MQTELVTSSIYIENPEKNHHTSEKNAKKLFGTC